GTPGGPAKDTTAPRLSKLTAKPAVATRARGKRKAKAATLRFSLSEAATVTFTGEQVLAGRTSGKRCVAGRKTGKACITYKKLGGSLRVNGKAGSGTASFAAKLGTKKLGAGRYRLTAVAIDAAGNRSAPVTIVVTVR
ncbi:MAG: repeat protein, partial [Conexibacter sp.]|nr:repeat protein [Conexibacter sp.]